MKQLKGLMLFLALIGLFVFACEKDEPFDEPEQTSTEEVADLRANTCTRQASSFKLTKDVELTITVCAKTPQDAEKAVTKTAILDAIRDRYFTGDSPLNPNCAEYDCNNASKRCVLGKVKAEVGDIDVVNVVPLPPDGTSDLECEEGKMVFTVTVKIEKLGARVKCECEKIETD